MPPLAAPLTIPPTATDPATYAECHAGCLRAIDDEIAAVEADLQRWGGDKPARVLGGVFEGAEGDAFVYAFTMRDRVRPPDFTAVDVTIRNTMVKGFVEAVQDEGGTLIITTEDALKGNLAEAVLVFDPTAILRALAMRVECLDPASTHPRMETVLRTLGYLSSTVRDTLPTHESLTRRGLNAGQRAAIGRAADSNVALIFGPPGTGKTRTLGSLVGEMVHTHGRRVLVTAHTHTALDTALASVLDAVGTGWAQAGHVVRLGKPSREYRHLGITERELAKRSKASDVARLDAALQPLEAEANRLLPPVATPGAGAWRSLLRRGAVPGPARPHRPATPDDRLSQLIGRLSTALETDTRPVVATLYEQVLALRSQVREDANALVREARVVGVTLARLAMEEADLGEFDTVVIDEGSMAMLPQVMVAAGFATSQVVVLGDPKQLPPVVQSRTANAMRFLKRDLFRHLGVDDPAHPDPRCPMLTMQYRMVPPIAALVSETFYAGRLENAPELECVPVTWPPLVLLDTSLSDARSERRGTSRANPSHAALVADLARQLANAGEYEVGIITPFAAQMQLLRQAVSAVIPRFFRGGGSVRTIHRAQGGEVDTIVLDTVDAPPVTSQFLDERSNEDLPRLLCVALSRAKRRLVIVAHAQSLRQRHGRRGALIMQLLTRAYREGTYLPVQDGLTPDDVATLLGDMRLPLTAPTSHPSRVRATT